MPIVGFALVSARILPPAVMDMATGVITRGPSAASSRIVTPEGSVSLSTSTAAQLSASMHATSSHPAPVHAPSRLGMVQRSALPSGSEQSRDVSRAESPAPSEAGDFVDNMSGEYPLCCMYQNTAVVV